MEHHDEKLTHLLSVVIDNYISKGEPIGSKYLHSLDKIDYAPSTLRKYLNLLEKSWFVYQPYNSSWRIPTLDGLAMYLDSYIKTTEWKHSSFEEDIPFDVKDARHGLRNIIESLWKLVDGVVVWFLRNDEYYFLGINNLLKDASWWDWFDTTRYIIDYIETKQIIWFLSTKMIKKNQVYYTFIQEETHSFSCLYAKVNVNDYDGIISIVWPMRVNYKKNLSILKKLLQLLW